MPSISPQAFRQWNQVLADVETPENHDRVPELLVRACRTLMPFNDALVVVFGRNIDPLPLFDDLPAHRHSRVIKSYYDGAYLLDPYYRAGMDGIESGLYRQKDVAPRGFKQSEYYRHYYAASGTGDEVGFISHLPDGNFVYIGINNTDSQPNFRKTDVDRLGLAQPIVHRILVNYCDKLQQASEGEPDLHKQLEGVLSLFGSSILTPREAEVVRLYLQGHSTNSISERLDITTHTVSMHRKNAYMKLDVRSQFELFHLFIDSLTCYDPARSEDPLRKYMRVG